MTNRDRRGSVDASGWSNPFTGLSGHVGDEVGIGVAMENRAPDFLCSGSYEKVWDVTGTLTPDGE